MAGTLQDPAGEDLDPTLNNVASTNNVFVNTQIPSVTLSAPGTVVNGTFTATITFSEKVTGLDAGDFTVTNATLSNLSTSDNITYTISVSPSADPVTLQLPAGKAINTGGNGNSASNTLSVIYDATAPTVTGVNVPADSVYTTSNTLDFTVVYSESVTVNTTGGTPVLPVDIGGTTVNATYVSGSGSNSLLFRYTVADGDLDMDGITVGSSLALNSGLITDNAGNNAVLTLNSVAGTTNVRVNTTHPSVTVNTSAFARTNVPFPVSFTFSEAVTNFTAGDIAVTNGTAGTLQTTDNITYTVQITPGVDGPVSINTPAGVAENIGHNSNTASNTISVTADFTAPVITPGQHFSILANSTVGTTINTATATDASGVIQNWAIASDPSGAFAIDAATGLITVNDVAKLNIQSGKTVTLNVTVNDGLNTSTATPVSIDVLPLNQAPTLDPIANAATCANSGTQTIQVTGASATEPTQSYTLSVTAGQPWFDVLSVTNAGVLSYKLKSTVTSGRGTITVIIQDNGGTANGGVDQSQQSFTLTVNPAPAITITSDKGNTVSKGEDVHLTATGAATYNWDNAGGIVSGQQTPVLEIRPEANTSYQLTATSTEGCTSTAAINIAIVEDFKVDATNVLTPNGDGKNDRWVIRNIDSYPNNELKIFDRAGRLVYSQRNYNNTWDGTMNGHPLAEGTYYYMLSITGSTKTIKGYITILLKAN